jgi:hypothetical protein
MTLPNPNKCKTWQYKPWLWECKVGDPTCCSYVIKVAGKSFCIHPKKQNFVEKEEEK